MTKKLKLKMISFILCFCMIFTSINISKLFYNPINASDTSDDGVTTFYYTGKTENYNITKSGYYIVEIVKYGVPSSVSIDFTTFYHC